MADYVTILGTRGSLPVGGTEYAIYGGATTCVLVCFGGKTVLLDAGTGLMALPEFVQGIPSIPLLLTHAHADHILALALCPYVMQQDHRLDIFTKVRDDMDGASQAERLFSPPLWPVKLDMLPADICFHTLNSAIDLDDIHVEVIEGAHPGGVSLFRLDANGKSVAFMPDFTLTEDNLPKYAKFARGCDLLLVDGQYSPMEWEEKMDFGHSSWIMAARLAEESGAVKARVIHHDPCRTDTALDAAAAELTAICPVCYFAKQGETIVL